MTALSFLLIQEGYLWAQPNFMRLADNISIRSIDAIRILESTNSIEISLTLINDDDKGIKVESGRFHVIINPEERPPIPIGSLGEETDGTADNVDIDHPDMGILPYTSLDLGTTEPIDFKIPGCLKTGAGGCRKPGEASVRAVIPLPRLRNMRDHVIFKLINYLGLPGSRKKTALIGQVRAGIEKNDGWSFFPVDIRFELYYAPKVQSEALFVGW